MFTRSVFASPKGFNRLLTTATAFTRKSNYGFVFDIDGVLLKGKQPIAEATWAIRLLNGENPANRRVPFVLVTNGGGTSEAAKAEQVSSLLNVKICPEQVVLSHSPIRALAKKYKDKRVLVVGGKEQTSADIATSYGFDYVVTPQDLLYWNNSLWPYSQPKFITNAAYHDYSKIPIEAVMVFHDSYDWGRDLQVVLDIVCSQNGIIGTLKKDFTGQSVPVYFTNNDVIWSTDFPIPRLGQGAFKAALEGLYKTLTGNKTTLMSYSYGKPHQVTYSYAEQLLVRQNKSISGKALVPDHIYAVGDNPASDIKGANTYGWNSILVRTGLHTDTNNSNEYPADVICDNVLDAVNWAINKEEGSSD